MSLIFRFKEWFHSKVIFLIALFLLFSNYNAAINFDRSFFLDLLFISIYLLSAAALGYYINDLFDQKKDEVAGKSNFAQQHNAVIVFTILTSLKLILFLNWFFFSSKALTGLLIGFQIILFYLYSNPITRLKEVYFFNIITDAVYAFVIPGFIIFFTVYGAYESAPFLVFILFLIWTFLMGIRGILYHYIKDYFNDLTSNTKTLATKIGVKQTSIINKNTY